MYRYLYVCNAINSPEIIFHFPYISHPFKTSRNYKWTIDKFVESIIVNFYEININFQVTALTFGLLRKMQQFEEDFTRFENILFFLTIE